MDQHGTGPHPGSEQWGAGGTEPAAGGIPAAPEPQPAPPPPGTPPVPPADPHAEVLFAEVPLSGAGVERAPGIAGPGDSGAGGPGLGVAGSAFTGPGGGGGFELPQGYHRRRRRPVLVLLVSLLVLAMAAAVAVPLVTGGQAASAAVMDALTSTTTQRTADVTMKVAVTAGSLTIHATGSGQADFSTASSSMTAGMTLAGQHISVASIVVAGTFYLREPGISKVEPGKEWVSANFGSLGGVNSPTRLLGMAGDPAGVIKDLQATGGTVASLGASMQGGVNVQGYRVRLDRTAIEANLKKAKLPSWLGQAGAGGTPSVITLTVYVAKSGLLHSVAIAMTLPVASSPVHADFTMTFSTYGAAVTIHPPPASSVVTIHTFEKATGSNTLT